MVAVNKQEVELAHLTHVKQIRMALHSHRIDHAIPKNAQEFGTNGIHGALVPLHAAKAEEPKEKENA